MSNQPPSDPQQYNPKPPYGSPRPDPARPPARHDPAGPGPAGTDAVVVARPPTYRPGYAPLPPVAPQNPPTSKFPPEPEYAEAPQYGHPPGYDSPPPPPGYNGPDYGPVVPPPRRSNVPLIAVILAVTLLLCGGAVTAGVLIVNNVTDRAKEAIEPITKPTLPTLPTEVPDLPTNLPDLPTDLPDLPTNLPDLPTNLPDLPGGGKKITVVYEVTGDGPAEIVYTEKLGESPKRVSNAKLPWKVTTSMKGAAFVSVTAVRSDTDSGTISCRATVDGAEVAQRTREGIFATASCNKMVLD